MVSIPVSSPRKLTSRRGDVESRVWLAIVSSARLTGVDNSDDLAGTAVEGPGAAGVVLFRTVELRTDPGISCYKVETGDEAKTWNKRARSPVSPFARL